MDSKKRNSSTELPDIVELRAIMKKEAWRKPASGKEDAHYPDFAVAIDWLKAIGMDYKLFTSKLPWEKVLIMGEEIKSEVVKRTLEKIDDGQVLKAVRRAADYLGESDKPAPSDLIFVFGSQSLSRIQTAVDLWKEGSAPRIFITGGHPNFKETESEAEVFKVYALKQGVPEEKIIIEPNAITIADNVRRSLNLFDKENIKHDSIILVTAWFAQRRSWAFMKKYTPPDCKLYRVDAPVKADGDYTLDRWFKNANGINIVFGELIKLKIAVALNTA